MKHTKNSKGFVAIIILIIISFLLASFIYFKYLHKGFPINRSETSDEIVSDSSSNIYSDSVIEFMYPNDFLEANSSNSKFSAKNDLYQLYFNWDANPNRYDTTTKEIETEFKAGELSSKVENINGRKIYFESVMSGNGFYSRNAYIPYNGGVIYFELSADTSLKGNEEPEIYDTVEVLLNKIINSIRLK
jgi:hypothetical protein